MVITVRKPPLVIANDLAAVQAPISRPAGLPTPRPFRHKTVDDTITTQRFVITGELADVVNTIKTNFGANVITRANEERAQYGRIMSGILTLDLCLGGGLMMSRAGMIYGNRSAGKSTIALRFIAAAQREHPDGVIVYLDVEGTFDPAWAKRLGVDLDRLLVLEPEGGEHAVDLADAVIRTKECAMVVTDSIAFLTPMKEIEESAEDSLPGIQARLMGKYIRKTNNALIQERHRGHYPVILHLNQWRMSIGISFGDPRVLPGGKALEFATSQQVEVFNKEHTADSINKAAKEAAKAAGAAPPSKVDKAEGGGALVVYNEHSFKITKDKTGGRMKEGKFKLIRDESQGLPVGYVDQSKTIISFGLASGVIKGAPNAFSHDLGKWRGQPDFVKWLAEHPAYERQICSEIVNSYKKKWGVSG